MSERDTFAALRRSQEDKFFIQREQELLAKLRRRLELQNKLGEMTEETRTANEALLADLERLGYTRETLSLVYLAPIVYVAWAEGSVTEGERARVLEIARERGIESGTPAYEKLVDWLTQRPADEVLETSIGIVQTVMHARAPLEEAAEKAEMVADIKRVIDATGDILLLWHTMSANEKTALNHIISELDREHYAAP